MSTKAIDAVLKQASSWGCVDGVTDAPCAHCAVIAARAELAAIRKAAKGLAQRGAEHWSQGAWDSGLDLMDKIAKESL